MSMRNKGRNYSTPLRVELLIVQCLLMVGCTTLSERQEIADWTTAQQNDTSAAYESFISQHPTSPHKSNALLAIRQRKSIERLLAELKPRWALLKQGMGLSEVEGVLGLSCLPEWVQWRTFHEQVEEATDQFVASVNF